MTVPSPRVGQVLCEGASGPGVDYEFRCPTSPPKRIAHGNQGLFQFPEPRMGRAYGGEIAPVQAMIIDLYNDNTNQLIGSITEADLQVLVDALEEESRDDHDYYIDSATIDVIADGRATEHLVNLLRSAVGNQEGIDIRWERR